MPQEKGDPGAMMVRHADGINRPAEVEFFVDGVVTSAPAGEPLATALAAAGLLRLRKSPRAGTPRGAFCFMGVCQECAIYVDGTVQQACMVPVRDGMVVELRGVT